MEKIRIEINGVAFDMLPVEGGHFVMGATAEQHGEAWGNETPTHSVSLEVFYLGETVVTWALWQAVMQEADAEEGDSNLPIIGKSWEDCQIFIQRLNVQTGRCFRLPTEAEWEYAARGGKQSKGYKFAGSNLLDEVAWYDKNSGGKIHPVRMKKPNELGLYDMSGNVWEWCADWYGEYERAEEGEEETAHNPKGPKKGSQRVVRGASSTYYARSCRVSCRLGFEPTGKNYDGTGLRLAMDEHPAAVEEPGTQSAQGGNKKLSSNPFMGTTGTNKNPTGNSSTGTSANSGHYWPPTGPSGGGRKRKVWPLIVAAAAVLLVVVLVSKGGAKQNFEPMANYSIADSTVVQTPAKQKEPKEPELSTEDLKQDFFRNINTAGSLFANNKLVINVDKDYTTKIKELSNGWNYLLEAEKINNNLKTLDSAYSSNCKQIKEIKDSYKDHFQELYNKECKGLTQLYQGGKYPESYESPINDYIKRIKQLKDFDGFDMIDSDPIAEKIIIEKTK